MKITGKTHLDHGINREWLAAEAAKLPDNVPFATVTVAIPDNLPSVPCGLHFDVPEAEVFYAKRGNRPNESRLCRRSPHLVREVTILGGGGEIWTAFGGPLAPKEPGDPYLKPEEAAVSEAFWAKAALSAEAFGVTPPK